MKYSERYAYRYPNRFVPAPHRLYVATAFDKADLAISSFNINDAQLVTEKFFIIKQFELRQILIKYCVPTGCRLHFNFLILGINHVRHQC